MYHTSNGLREEKNEQENAAQRKTGERESVLVYGNWRVCVFVSISFIFILILHFCRILLIIKWKHFECIHTHTHAGRIQQFAPDFLTLSLSILLSQWLSGSSSGTGSIFYAECTNTHKKTDAKFIRRLTPEQKCEKELTLHLHTYTHTQTHMTSERKSIIMCTPCRDII